MSRHEVLHMFEQSDAATTVLGAAYLSMLAMTSLLGLTACAAAWHEDGAPRFWLAVMAASALCGAGLATISGTLLVVNPDQLRVSFFPLVQALTAPALLLLAVAATVILWPRKRTSS
ncbi:hypothetical protein [Nocardia sp. NPDC055049]